MMMSLVLSTLVATVSAAWSSTPLTPVPQPPSLDNAVINLPVVECLEDRLQLTFQTQRPFVGRIFVKGMSAKDSCKKEFIRNTNPGATFELHNGDCNMRRTRMVRPDKSGVEQSVTIIISFHSTFITKVDRAYRCTCFYMENDRVVTSKFDVSMLPTTDLSDTVRMPLCTYTVRAESINGPTVQFAKVGDQVFHVWQCDSDMYSMLVHSCFVDDSNGQERKPFLDEHGCAIDPIIVPDLIYNKENNLAFAPVNVFKFADKITTYFQCAISACLNSEGTCNGRTPPRCGPSGPARFGRSIAEVRNSTRSRWIRLDNTMDVSAQKITVLDLEETPSGTEATKFTSQSLLDPSPINRATHSVIIDPYTAAAFVLIAIGATLAVTVLGLLLILRYKARKIFE